MTDKPLSGRIALVTGASRGIGAAIAETLAGAGAHVVITARTAAGLEEVEDRIHQAGGSATIAPLDMTDNESIGRLAQAVAGRWDALDIMIMNAAMLGTLSSVTAIDGKEFAKLLTLNVVAQQALLAAFDPLLRASDHPRIMALTSSVGAKPRAYWGAYGASKSAFETMLLAYADEVRAISGVRVAIVDPGATATEMRRKAYPGEDQAELQQPAEVGAAILRFLRDDFQSGFRFRIAGSARNQPEAVGE
jgi:NAD(P)-dependent dehydrogenase (short-subunit alcohol dehydrogenase family)